MFFLGVSSPPSLSPRAASSLFVSQDKQAQKQLILLQKPQLMSLVQPSSGAAAGAAGKTPEDEADGRERLWEAPSGDAHLHYRAAPHVVFSHNGTCDGRFAATSPVESGAVTESAPASHFNSPPPDESDGGEPCVCLRRAGGVGGGAGS